MRTAWQLIRFIILITSLASAYEIRYVGELPAYSRTIFELEYQQVYQAYKSFLPASQFVPSIIGLSTEGRDNANSNASSNITDQQKINPNNKDNSSKKSLISQFLIGTLKKIEKNIKDAKKAIIQEAAKLSQMLIHSHCSKNEFMFQQHLTEITMLDIDVSFLLPGQLIQLKDPSNFAKGVQLYQSKEYTRHKLDVKLSNGLLNRPLMVDPANNNLSKQIMDTLSNHLEFLNSQPIKLYIQTSNRLQVVLRRLGLSSKIYEILKLGNGYRIDPKLEKKIEKVEKKIVIVLHQSLFSAALDLTNAVSERSSTFFNVIFETYSQKMLQQLREIMEKEEESAPLVITQANFGRLLILTLQQDLFSQELVGKLTKCFTNDKLQDNQGFAATMLDIAKFRPLFYYAGVTMNQQLTRSGIDWQDIFFPITSASIYNLKPISASATSLTGHPYVQSQRRYYTLQICRNKIEILVFILVEYVILQGVVTPIRPEDKHPFNLTHPGTFQISSLVGSQPFELNLVARSTAKLRRLTRNGASYGIRFFFLKKKPVYSIQAEFALLVNGEERLRHAIGNSRSDRQYHGVRIRIDPNHLVGMKILEDF